jgi:hypothetical protein
MRIEGAAMTAVAVAGVVVADCVTVATGALVAAGASVGVAVRAGAASAVAETDRVAVASAVVGSWGSTLNRTAASLQEYSVPQPGEKTPTLRTYAPGASFGPSPTVKLRDCPAKNASRSKTVCRTRFPPSA